MASLIRATLSMHCVDMAKALAKAAPLVLCHIIWHCGP
jgi:hypothetical protein